MAASAYDKSGLTPYLTKIRDQFATDRSREIEPKWNINRSDFFAEFRQLWKSQEGEKWRSRDTAGIVGQKVRALFSIILDVYLQSGRIPFKFLPFEKLQYLDNPSMFSDFQDDLDLATERVEQAFVRCHAERAFIDNAFTACLLGKTYAKVTRRTFNRTRNVPVMPAEQAMAMGIDPATLPWKPLEVEEEGDAWEFVSNWEMFGDPEYAFHCRNGSMVFQTQMMSPYMLSGKRKDGFIIEPELQEVLDESAKAGQSGTPGISDQALPPYLRNLSNRQRMIRYDEGWGRVPADVAQKYVQDTLLGEFSIDPASMNARTDGTIPESKPGEEVYIHACLADGKIVRFALCDPQDNPFFETDLEHLPDEATGRGVADNARMGHELVSKALRAYVDNKAWSANVQMAMKKRLFTKTPDAMRPGGLWYLSEDAKSASDAMQQIIVQDVGESLMSMISLGERYADWDTMLAKVEQGQFAAGKRTATEIVEQSKRSDSYTGGVIRNFDEGLTEPIAERFFLNMVYDPDVKGGKGDFTAQAMGFESYQENIQTLNNYLRFFEICLRSPEAMSEVKMRGLLEPIAKKMRLDTRTLLKTIAEKAAEAQQRLLEMQAQSAAKQPPPVIPQASEPVPQ
jgi:hypothetical protein